MSWIIGLVSMERTVVMILALISFGCVIAALGELTFSKFGFICQVLAVAVSTRKISGRTAVSRLIPSPFTFVTQVESARLVSVQVLIGSKKLSPLVLVYLYAPVSHYIRRFSDVACAEIDETSFRLQLCFVVIAILQPILEGPEAWAHLQNVGISTTLISGGLAFALNIAGVYLIHSAGSLVLTLSGVLKVRSDSSEIRSTKIYGSSRIVLESLGYRSDCVCRFARIGRFDDTNYRYVGR
jgi:hypothetical protein